MQTLYAPFALAAYGAVPIWWLHACIDATCVVCCIMQNRMQDVEPCRPVTTTDLDSFSWSTAIYLLNTCTVLHDALHICCSKATPDARFAQQIAYRCMLKSHVAGLDCRLFADNARSQSMPKTWSVVGLQLKRAIKTALLCAFINNSCLQSPELSH